MYFISNQANATLSEGQKLFKERLNRVETAIHLGEPDKVPVFTFFSSYIQRAYNSNYSDIFYNFEAAGEAALKFHQDYPQLDIALTPQFVSGKANEIAGATMVDWPGRPGTRVSPFSSHQIIERELMMQEEYSEMLNDFSGFMLRKYVPRAFSNLKGTSMLNLIPTVVTNTSILAPFSSQEAQDTFQKLAQIGAENKKAAAATAKYSNLLADMGFPPMMTGISEAPYDILGDYFRGTMGIFEDMTDPDMEDYVEHACYMFAEQQIQSWQYVRFADMPVKRVFFPLHKAMDGFMSDSQYERFYWKPLKKIILALIDMNVTPYIYTEGPYHTRLHHLTDVPIGKVFYHFEDVDMAEAKRILGNTAAICGNLSISRMEFGKKEDIAEDVKRLLDVCAPGGGYLFDFNGSLENCKPENLEIMFETLDKYGKY